MEHEKHIPPQPINPAVQPPNFSYASYGPYGGPGQHFATAPTAPSGYGISVAPGIYQPPPPPIIQNVQPPRSFSEMMRRNKPQITAVLAGSMIFVSGGMNIAWSIGLAVAQIYGFNVTHLAVSWFIGAIIGVLVSLPLAKVATTKLIIQMAAVLLAVGGIIIAATHYNETAMIAARYINGIAMGLVFAPSVAHAGEVSFKSMRGLVTSLNEHFFMCVGIFLQLLYSLLWAYGNSLNADQMHGIFNIIFGFFAFVGATFVTLESPILLLSHELEHEAIDVLRRLQYPPVLTNLTMEQLEEHKHYLSANGNLSFAESARLSSPALLRMCIYRGLHGMSVSIIVLFCLVITSFASWQLILFGAVRLIGSLIALFIVDAYGRKPVAVIGFLVCGAMYIGVAADITSSLGLLEAALILLLVSSFFSGFVGNVSTVYLSEAFPFAVKRLYISIAFSVEMLVQIIIVCSAVLYLYDTTRVYFYFMAALYIAGCLLVLCCLPETKNTTLREAQEKFRAFFSFGFR